MSVIQTNLSDFQARRCTTVLGMTQESEQPEEQYLLSRKGVGCMRGIVWAALLELGGLLILGGLIYAFRTLLF